MKTTEVKPLPEQPDQQKVHKEFSFDAANEVNFVPLNNVNTKVEVQKEVQPVVVKEVSRYMPTDFRGGSYFSNYLESVMSIFFRMPQVEYKQQVQWWIPPINSVYRSPQVGQ